MDGIISNDHDLLISIAQQVSDLRREVQELKNGTVVRIESLERDKADGAVVAGLQKKVNEDHEKRIMKLENDNAIQFGAQKGVGISWNVLLSIAGIAIAILAIIYGMKHGI